MKFNPYLNFDGNCREAFDFYAKTLGGEIMFSMTFADMPEEEQDGEACGGAEMPEGMDDKIMHVSMEVGNITLMGSDAPGEYVKPQGMHVAINLDTPEEAERVYKALSEGGEIIMPIQETFWAQRFAMFTDRFGTPWMIDCDKPMEG